MITEAEIIEIDYGSNHCIIHIPLFDTAQQLSETTARAVFAIPPGIYNSYNIGDLVWVGFERDHVHYPVILGKIYRSAQEESQHSGTAINCSSIKCADSAVMPANTDIVSGKTKLTSLNEIAADIKYLKSGLNGDITTKLLASRYSTILKITDLSAPIILQTALQYNDIAELKEQLSTMCTSVDTAFPVSNQTYCGIYCDPDENKLYGVNGSGGGTLLEGQGITIQIRSIEITRI